MATNTYVRFGVRTCPPSRRGFHAKKRSAGTIRVTTRLWSPNQSVHESAACSRAATRKIGLMKSESKLGEIRRDNPANNVRKVFRSFTPDPSASRQPDASCKSAFHIRVSNVRFLRFHQVGVPLHRRSVQAFPMTDGSATTTSPSNSSGHPARSGLVSPSPSPVIDFTTIGEYHDSVCHPANIFHLPQLNYPATNTKLELCLFAGLPKMATASGIAKNKTQQTSEVFRDDLR